MKLELILGVYTAVNFWWRYTADETWCLPRRFDINFKERIE